MVRDEFNENDERTAYRLCVAPMMDWTDRHCRYFHRLLAPDARLYTEMVTTGAVIHGNRQRLLGFSPEEHPVALQLGGSDPGDLARCARVAQERGFDEVNLNVGCPSDRVQQGRFGACLMLEPALVGDCVAAMRAAVSVPVTVKCRLGVDDQDSYELFAAFVETVADAGCDTFIVHARKAILAGLSPKENREVPPLHHDRVWRIKREHPRLRIVLNGGVDSLPAVRSHLERVDGVMLGRSAYHQPWLLAECQRALFDRPAPRSRGEVVECYSDYLQRQVAAGVPVKHLTRHVLGLYAGRPGARQWRRHLSENAHLDDRNTDILFEARAAMRAVAAA